MIVMIKPCANTFFSDKTQTVQLLYFVKTLIPILDVSPQEKLLVLMAALLLMIFNIVPVMKIPRVHLAEITDVSKLLQLRHVSKMWLVSLDVLQRHLKLILV